MKLLIAFFLFISTSADGQDFSATTLSGKVITKHSRVAIPNATIQYLQKYGVLTDSLGQFAIRGITDDSLLLEFSALGYPTKDTLLNLTEIGKSEFIWEIEVDCAEFHEARAVSDLNNGKVMFILQGGIAPIVYKSETRLSKKFGVNFLELGCSIIDHFECLAKYNKTVALFLDKNYGTKWRKNLNAKIYGVTM